MELQDRSPDALHAELDEIFRRLLKQVGEEAAGTVESALEPTRKSHADLLEAAAKAKSLIDRSEKIVGEVKQIQDSIASAATRASEKVISGVKSTQNQLEAAARKTTSANLDLIKAAEGIKKKLEAVLSDGRVMRKAIEEAIDRNAECLDDSLAGIDEAFKAEAEVAKNRLNGVYILLGLQFLLLFYLVFFK